MTPPRFAVLTGSAAVLNAFDAEFSFVQEVLARRPRLVTCDFDGTLWPHDAGSGFTAWEIAAGRVDRDVAAHVERQYARYLAGEFDEDSMCALQVTMHRGRDDASLHRHADDYVRDTVVPQWFPAMQTLLQALRVQGCEIWLVSSSSQWVIAAGARALGLDASRVLAAAAAIVDGRATDRLLRLPSGAGKAQAIREVVGRVPDMAFGNSRWDAEMLRLAQRAYAVHPSVELEALALHEGWRIVRPTRADCT